MAHTTRDRRKPLKPTGHSAAIEAMIQPAIVIGSTLMSGIAVYVLAYDEITRALAALHEHRMPAFNDMFVIVLCAGMGYLVDMAIIISATRYQMHTVRNDPKEKPWLRLAKSVLVIGLASETMTLFYFFVHTDPGLYPAWMVQLADLIHAILSGSRAFLPPITIAYFAAGVLPISFTRADRNREIKSRTSLNIMTLLDRLGQVPDTEEPAEQLRALGNQLQLATYAEYDETARTSEADQNRRDAKLITQMARAHGLDWSAIGADIAPELTIAPPTIPTIPTAPATHATYTPPTPAARVSITPGIAPNPDLPAGYLLPAPEDPRPPTSAPNAANYTNYTNQPPQPQPRRRSGGPARATGATAATGSRRRAAPNPSGIGASPKPSVGGVAPVLDRAELRRRREAAVAAILNGMTADKRAKLTNAELARRIAMYTHQQCGETTARELRAKYEELESIQSIQHRPGAGDTASQDGQEGQEGGVA